MKLARGFLMVTTLFNGIAGIICGVLFVLWPDGSLMAAQGMISLLQNFPLADVFFRDFFWIGVAMLLVLALPSTVAGIMLLRRAPHQYRWALVSSIMVLLWCAVEMPFLPNPLCVFFAVVAGLQITAAIYLKRIEAGLDPYVRESITDFFNDKADNYDAIHLGQIRGGMESKEVIATLLPAHTNTILDLGIGTGLELAAIFERFPGAQITGVDIAQSMLDKLHSRFPGKSIVTHCGSYLDQDFPSGHYNAVVSAMSLHHISPGQKQVLYRRLCDSLAPGGTFINCDFFAATVFPEWFGRFLYATTRKPAGSMHINMPLTPGRETAILRGAGFVTARSVWQNGQIQIIQATVA